MATRQRLLPASGTTNRCRETDEIPATACRCMCGGLLVVVIGMKFHAKAKVLDGPVLVQCCRCRAKTDVEALRWPYRRKSVNSAPFLLGRG